MVRAEIESHGGYNVVLAKLYETHDGLRRVARELEGMARELEARVGSSPAEEWIRKAATYHHAFQETIHAHHAREDQEIFPYVEAWYDFDCAALDAQHATLNRAIPEVAAAITPLLAGGVITAEGSGALVQATSQMRAILESHLDHEEATIFVTLLRLTEEDIDRMFLGATPTV